NRFSSRYFSWFSPSACFWFPLPTGTAPVFRAGYEIFYHLNGIELAGVQRRDPAVESGLIGSALKQLGVEPVHEAEAIRSVAGVIFGGSENADDRGVGALRVINVFPVLESRGFRLATEADLVHLRDRRARDVRDGGRRGMRQRVMRAPLPGIA